jgi:1,4-dihydroxy-2-naphthoate octaprenyltransferase
VLTGRYSWSAAVASLVPFFLVNNLLLLNQYPDLDADQSVGRRRLPITLGKPACNRIIGAFVSLAFLVILFGVALGQLPVTSLIAMTALVLAVPMVMGVYRSAEQTAKLLPYMGLNVIVNLMIPVLIAAGLLIS